MSKSAAPRPRTAVPSTVSHWPLPAHASNAFLAASSTLARATPLRETRSFHFLAASPFPWTLPLTLAPGPAHARCRCRYVRIYESRIESQLKKEGYTIEQFQELCLQIKDSHTSYGLFIEVLASVDSFQHFVDMMRSKRRQLE